MWCNTANSTRITSFIRERNDWTKIVHFTVAILMVFARNDNIIIWPVVIISVKYYANYVVAFFFWKETTIFTRISYWICVLNFIGPRHHFIFFTFVHSSLNIRGTMHGCVLVGNIQCFTLSIYKDVFLHRRTRLPRSVLQLLSMPIQNKQFWIRFFFLYYGVYRCICICLFIIHTCLDVCHLYCVQKDLNQADIYIHRLYSNLYQFVLY